MSETSGHYIAACLEDIVAACVQPLAEDQQDLLCQLAQQMATYFNLCFRARSSNLKSLYRHFNPTLNARSNVPADQRADLKEQFFEQIEVLLNAANYQQLSLQEIRAALEEQALFDLNVTVNLDDYDKLLVFRRRAERQSMVIKRWLGRFGERQVEFINYDRVALIFSENTAGSDVHIKLFQNVPRHDIEILLPEPQVRMRLRDKLMIGVPAVAGGIIVLITKLGPTLLLAGSVIAFWLGMKKQPVTLDQGVLVGLGVGFAALGGHLWRQLGAVKNRRLAFLKTLTENLYFKTLDNNSGAIQQLLDTAVDEELKEIFLLYSFLLSAREPLTAVGLDQRIEGWLDSTLNCKADFDVGGAVNKAVNLGIVHASDGKYCAVKIEDALIRVNESLGELVFPV